MKKNQAKTETEQSEKQSPAKLPRAKKAHTICQNDVKIEIKVGDDLSEVPEVYHANLKTEGVI